MVGLSMNISWSPDFQGAADNFLDMKKVFLEHIENPYMYGLQAAEILDELDKPSSFNFSMPSIMLMAAAHFKIDRNSPTFHGSVFAGQLGGMSVEGAENTTFHAASSHPRKVLLQTIRLMSTHNELVDGGLDAPTFNPRDASLLMAAAAIHDYKHDGVGNCLDGVHQQYRLEDIAFEEFTKQLGNQFSSDDLKDLQVILKCTDVSSTEGPFSEDCPANLLKKLYNNEITKNELPPELQRLAGNEKLVLMALTLHTADLATSAGLSVERTKIESRLLATEIGVPEVASAESSQGFIAAAQLLILPAAKAVYKCNPATIAATIQFNLTP